MAYSPVIHAVARQHSFIHLQVACNFCFQTQCNVVLFGLSMHLVTHAFDVEHQAIAMPSMSSLCKHVTTVVTMDQWSMILAAADRYNH